MNATRLAYLQNLVKRYRAFMNAGPRPQGEAAQGAGEPDVIDEGNRVAIRLYAYIDSHFILELFGVPGSVAVSDTGFARSLERAQELAAGRPVVVRVNSMGGDVFAGIAIANMVTDAGLPAIVDSNAASIASVIIAGSPHVTMKPGATVMVHNPWADMAGNAAALRAEADVLDKLRESMLDIYTAKTGPKYTRAQWAAALDGVDGADGSWLSASEALAAGLADEAPSPQADRASAAMVEERRAAAAFHGVKLPQTLSETPAQADPEQPEGPASGEPAEQTERGVRVSHRKGSFYIPRA